MGKIDSSGNYTKHPGATVICPLITDVSAFHAQYDKFMKDNHHPYATLPLDSMHMTLYGLWSQKIVGKKEYARLLKEHAGDMQHVQRLLQSMGSGVSMHVSSVYASGIALAPSTFNDGENVAGNETIVLNTFDHVRTVNKHMTLSYRYAECDKSVVNHVADIANRYLPEKLEFGVPVVCTFQDMKKYTPIPL